MQRLILLLAGSLALALPARAKIGWTYAQCVAHWGKETDRIFLQDGYYRTETPLFMFRLGKRYVVVEFSVIDGWFSYEKSKVIKETPNDNARFRDQ